MKTLTVEIPDMLTIDNNDIKMLIASSLYERGYVSSGEGAKIAGVTKRTFIELLGKSGVSVFNYGKSDIENDIKNA